MYRYPTRTYKDIIKREDLKEYISKCAEEYRKETTVATTRQQVNIIKENKETIEVEVIVDFLTK